LDLIAPSLSLFCTSDRAQSIDRHDPADGTRSKASLRHFASAIEDEICRVIDFPSIFPIRANLVGVIRDFQSTADRKRRAGFLHHFFGFFQRIDRQCDDVDVFLFEFVNVRLEVG
jgi:hypothetical protein